MLEFIRSRVVWQQPSLEFQSNFSISEAGSVKKNHSDWQLSGDFGPIRRVFVKKRSGMETLLETSGIEKM